MDRSPVLPFDDPYVVKPEAVKSTADPVLVAAFRGAVTGADAYHGVRQALRLDGEVLRLGNRFVRPDRYREIAFLAFGTAAVSQALAVNDALGEKLTQGFLAGPSEPPRQLPFRSAVVPSGWPGLPAAESARASAQELARDLTGRDLLIVLLSPGALGTLSAPPDGMDSAGWRQWLVELGRSGISGSELGRVARVLGGGLVGGQLRIAAGDAEVETFVVDRGDGATVGGGPTRWVTDSERAGVRSTLERAGLLSRIDARMRARLSADPARPLASARSSGRPVVVAGPADALSGAADAVGERRWMPRLAGLYLPGPPERVAEAFLARVESLREQYEGAVARARREGLIAFATTTLDLPEGIDERPAMAEWLNAASGRWGRTDRSLGILRTAGSGDASPPGFVRAPDGRVRPVRMPAGVTDIGLLLLAQVPLATAGS